MTTFTLNHTYIFDPSRLPTMVETSIPIIHQYTFLQHNPRMRIRADIDKSLKQYASGPAKDKVHLKHFRCDYAEFFVHSKYPKPYQYPLLVSIHIKTTIFIYTVG